MVPRNDARRLCHTGHTNLELLVLPHHDDQDLILTDASLFGWY